MNEKLEDIKKENYIIIIYYILLTIYLYANYIETQYIKYGNEINKDKYRILLYIVFGTTFIITLYYTIEGIHDLKQISNPEVKNLQELSNIANLLVFIASIIILYIIYKDKDINLEVSP